MTARSSIPATHRRPRALPPRPAGAGGDVAAGVTLHIGDCRAILPALELDPARTVAITDPPWPEAPAYLLEEWGVDDCAALLAETFELLAPLVRRLVVVVGCSTDPRILTVPRSLPFVRTCWLRYALPSPRGTILNSGDVAFVFGSREAGEGMTLLPGEVTSNIPRAKEGPGSELHPTPRREQHMRWIIRHLTRTGDTVLDPFAGSCTTLLAARDAGRRAIGIDKDPRSDAAARARFSQQSLLTVGGTP